MNNIKVSTTVRIVNTDALYRRYEEWLTPKEIKVWDENNSPSIRDLFTVISIRKHSKNNTTPLAFCVSETTGQGYIMGLKGTSVVFHSDPTVTKVKRKLYAHYSIQAKRNITREYLELPRCSGGHIKRGTLVPLFAKYGVAIKSSTSACRLLKDKKGWIWQYNNGGWDTSNAVAFKRTREIRGVL